MNVCERNVTGSSWPLCSCDSCNLQVSSEVSLYTLYQFKGSGYCNMYACMRAPFRLTNAW